jgi:hypothetical protein
VFVLEGWREAYLGPRVFFKRHLAITFAFGLQDPAKMYGKVQVRINFSRYHRLEELQIPKKLMKPKQRNCSFYVFRTDGIESLENSIVDCFSEQGK